MKTVLESAKDIFDEIVAIRRDIHRHPERGRQEVRTSKLIREKLTEYGVDRIESLTPTSVCGYIHGTKDNGRTVAIRCDIDALPVQEETGLEFASETPGVMHACGHDLHCSMLLGDAKLLCERRDQFQGTVKLIFQHSEDLLPGGAKELTELGVMDDVDAIFGMHNLPTEEKCGVVALCKGPFSTSVDLFDVTVQGVGGHGSTPHLTKDPILAACEAVTLLERVEARGIDPMETVIFPVCQIRGGNAPNVIPDTAMFQGVARAYTDEVRASMVQQVFDILKGEEIVSGCKMDINHYEGYPATYNDPELSDLVYNAVGDAIGKDRVEWLDRPMTFSEDFSYYTKMTGKPGVYVMLQAGHEGELVPLHNGKCHVKEEAMIYGMAAMTSMAMAYLNR